MNDDDMLAAMRSSLTIVRDSLTDVHMNRPPEAIIARAHNRRLRRGLPGVGAAALVLGVAMALTLGGSPRAAQPVHVNLDAWSVNSTSAGLVTVTIRQLKDPAALSRTLADAGIPVKLIFGRVCTPEDGNLSELSRVLRKVPGRSPGDLVLTINPAAMLKGTELVIGIGHLRIGPDSGPAAAFGLTRIGSPLNCGASQAGKGTDPAAAKTGTH